MNHPKRVAAAAVAALAGVAGCTYSSTDASSIECSYNGGPFDGKDYRGVVDPGSGRTYQGLFSESVSVPVSVRQYDQSDGLKPVVVSVRGIQQTYAPVLNFTISTVENADGKPAACDLVEKHLRALGATDFNDEVADSKWVQDFLNVRIQPLVGDSIARELQSLDPTALAQNISGARDDAAAAVGQAVTEAAADALGGDYFCQPSYEYGAPAEQCGTINVVLTAPAMAPEDAELVAAPQRASTEANNEIAVAREEARKAAEVAEQRAIEAESAVALADAEVQIAEEQARVEEAQAAIDYANCAYLASLGQDCALVVAAENSDFPDVISSTEPVVAVTPSDAD